MSNTLLPKYLFTSLSHTSLHVQDQSESSKSFQCEIFYITLKNLQNVKLKSPYKSKVSTILKKAHVKLHKVLDINYPGLQS
jgi:hypothetical protein